MGTVWRGYHTFMPRVGRTRRGREFEQDYTSEPTRPITAPTVYIQICNNQLTLSIPF